MALYDNKLWLLSHIHNSFISSDDTGVCEMVLGAEDFKAELREVAKHQGLPSFVGCISDEEEDEEVDSFRQRSPSLHFGTAEVRARVTTEMQRQEEVVIRAAAAAPVKTVVWKEADRSGATADPDELERLFPRKEPQPRRRTASLLSRLLEEQPEEAANPWLEYAKYNGAGCADMKSAKAVAIFCPMTQGDGAFIPLRVSCSREARVADLIGLTCYLYTLEDRQPRLEPPVENYSLFMCEEDGNVDWDFPALDQTDMFSKYGFSQLTLVERPAPEAATTCVTLHMPDGTFSQIEIQRRDITLGELMEKAMERRKNLAAQRFNFGYHMEAADEPGVALDPATSLNSTGESDFYIVRDNSKRISGPRDPAQGEVCFWEAPLFQSFNVEIFTKVRTKVEIHLGISGERVEIDPCQQASTARFWQKQKAVSYDLDRVVSCEVVEQRAGRGAPVADRQMFRLVWLAEGGWRQQDFEGDTNTVAAVVQKLNHLLDLRQSEARRMRREYLEQKEKKKARLRTITK